MFGQSPFSIMFPMAALPQPNQTYTAANNEVPARVRTAMEFLQQLSFKTMTRAAVWDSGCDWSTQTDLTKEEKLVQSNACHLLSSYFSGKFEMDPWERTRFEQSKGNVIPRDKPGSLMRCPSCAPGRGRADCPLCEGGGQVLIYAQPTGAEG